MNWILAVPLDVRLILLLLLGTIYGAMANLAVYRLAWRPRAISPWIRPDAAAPPRRWSDRLPIFGWLGLRREAHLHGTGFWIRPLLVEFFCGLGLAQLYYWEVEQAALFPAGLGGLINPAMPGAFSSILHQQYVAHAILIWLMLVASLIDADEKTIPDAVTRPGTLIGLFLAAVWPWSLLPDVFTAGGRLPFGFLRVTSPNDWPAWLDGWPRAWPLAIGLGCWVLWCLAILPRTWYARHGRRRAWELCWARLTRHADSYWIALMCVVGAVLIGAVWHHSRENWQALLSSLVGMAVGGGMIWFVRIAGRAVLNQEAMGFGDVTLMSMIGAFLGWQACLIVFFLAPFAALAAGLLRYFLLRDREIPFGPFLCLGALVSIVYWAAIWDWASGIFSLGWLVPVVIVAALLLIGPLLILLRAVLSIFHMWRE